MRRAIFIVWAALGLSAGCSSHVPAGPTAPVELANDQVSVTVTVAPFGLTVRNARGEVLVHSFGAATPGNDPSMSANLAVTHRAVTFKNHIIEGWDYQDATYDPFAEASHVTHEEHTATTAKLDVSQGAISGTVDVTLTGAEVAVDIRLAGPPNPIEGDEAIPGANVTSMAFTLPPDEHFFGLGERLVTVDHRGRKYESWTEEGGVGGGEHAPPGPSNPSPNGPQMTHKPIPFFLSSKGYALWMDTGYRTGTSFGAELPNAWRLYANEPALHLHLYVHDEPKDSIADFTAKTGRAHLPAEWIFGPRMRLDTNKQINGVPEILALRQQGVPCTAADDATHFLPIGSQVGREAELTKWTADLHAGGYKALAYYNAYVSVSDPRAAADVAEARKNGYFVKKPDGSELTVFLISAGAQTVATIDMTNPDAVKYYERILQRGLDLGYDGWMLDFGEYLPANARMFDGRTGWEMHNLFPVIYQKATSDYVRKVRGDDFMFFARAGYTGTQAVATVVWSGDPAASFDDAKGLPSVVRAGVNAGMSGLPFWGSDVSGYTCQNDPPADKEVFLRWAAFGALSPIMEYENACSGGMSAEKWNVWSDAETTKIFGDYTRLHTRLFPYLYAAAKEATLSGLPLMRHPFLVHPKSAEAYAVDLEYYLGPSLYVAPVVRRGATTRDVWLPPGRWVDWFSLEPLASGKVTRPAATFDTMPLFLKSGGMVPLLDPTIQTLVRTATDPTVVTLDSVKGVLDVRVALDASAKDSAIILNDGTSLRASLAPGALALPADITLAATDAELSTCASCGKIEALASGVQRVRISTSASTVAVGALTLSRPAGTQRIRWDVAALP